jgi:hypothetical protein
MPVQVLPPASWPNSVEFSPSSRSALTPVNPAPFPANVFPALLRVMAPAYVPPSSPPGSVPERLAALV